MSNLKSSSVVNKSDSNAAEVPNVLAALKEVLKDFYDIVDSIFASCIYICSAVVDRMSSVARTLHPGPVTPPWIGWLISA